MNARRWVLAATGLLLLLLSVGQILAAGSGLATSSLRSTDPPLTLIAPQGAALWSRPLVLIAHGYASSSVMMRGFALTLAHAGYSAILWDFDGHGANPRALASDGRGDSLLANAEAALKKAGTLGAGDPGQVAILGHSMGSGVALVFGQQHPTTAATLAISPVNALVTPELPRNLLLMAGSLEAPYLRNARDLLARAGGSGGNTAAGTARKMVTIPVVEHVSILFSTAAHTAARDWLDATFGPQPDAAAYTDRRLLWYGIGVLGALLAAGALAPLVSGPSRASQPQRSLGRRLGALGGGVLGATLALRLLGGIGLALRSLFDLQVGGYLCLWFGVAGLLGLALLQARPRAPSRRDLVIGLLVFAVLWVGVGLLGQLVWLPWLLVPRRLLLWPLGALLLLPWFLAAGETVRDSNPPGRAGWWLAHSLILAGSLSLTIRLSPELGFLILVLPLFPLVLGLHALAAGTYRGAWPFALSGGLFTSWLLLAVFPLG
jgi:pimeloyl-ACP methyl ester carboxylesterase